MTLPVSASKTNLDSATDDPKLARVDLADLVDKFNALLVHLNLSASTSGPLALPVAVADGGTGSSSASGARTNLGLGALAVLSSIANANIDANTIQLAKLARVGTAGQVLTSNGAGADPSYQTPASVGNDVALLNAGVI
jgi:hypothetical protein